ncbi:MAG: hypothetical protein JWL86_2798 [Rhizobium sp.]|nr:hypothetical protein [Rhizobium sp.]
MNDEAEPDSLVAEPAKYPDFHYFPDELIQKWVEIPWDEPLVIGPLNRSDLDNLLFSTADMTRAVHSLRGALVLFSKGDIPQADIAIQNCIAAANDAETRNRLLYQAIMESVLKVRDAAK